MKPRGTLARLVINRIGGIAVCALAAGPIIVFTDLVIEAMRGRALTSSSATLWSEPIPEILATFAMMAMITLPTVGAIALGMYVLAKLSKDGFLIATASGAIAGYGAITMTFLIATGDAPGLEFDKPSNTRSLANMLLVTLAISVLYWVLSIRRERNWRRIDMQDDLTLRAME